MNDENAFQRCLGYIDCELTSKPLNAPHVLEVPSGPAITLSRQAGTGAHRVADHLAEILQQRAPGKDRPWTVFDKNLIERILEDHNLPKRLASFMPEDRVSAISDMVQELCGVHPSRWTLMHQAAETMIRLADLGRVILVGRGASAVTTGMRHIFHVRLIGSLERRAANLADTEELTKAEAREKAKSLDSGQRRYLKRYFHRDIEDCLMYHLILNTDQLDPADSAGIIADAALRYLKKEAQQQLVEPASTLAVA